ncbi:glycosyl hydrolase family 28-related protein [Bacteroidota bacterium]
MDIVKICLLIGLFSTGTAFSQLSGSWQLYETTHPVDIQLVALHIDVAAGMAVDNTGSSDVTAAFQKAIDQVFDMGGGAIYVPSGNYRFDGNLVVKEGVNLRGDFTVPEGQAVSGSILKVYSGRNSPNSDPFITIRGCACIDGFTIWYPEQDASSIVPYPPAIRFQKNSNGRYSKHSTRARCINLVNAYFGIDIGIVNTAIPQACHIYGSSLSKGIRINECTDVSRIFDIHFSPEYWTESGLPGAPAEKGPHADFMYEQGHAMDYIRSDNGFNGFWFISGYNKGLSINSNYSGGPFYRLEFTNCKEALILQIVNQVPACFTDCIFEGSEASLVQEEMTGTAQFNTTRFGGGSYSVKPAGEGSNSSSQVSFQDCVFEAPAQLTGLATTIANSTFDFTGDHVILDGDCKNAILMDNTFIGGRSIINNMSNKENALIRDTSKTYLSTPDFEYDPFVSHAPTRVALYMATDFSGVVEGDDFDDGPGIQLALDKASQEGGGIVYLPSGEYDLKSSISIPENVELRGALDMPQHSKLWFDKSLVHEFGSVLYVDHNRGSSSGSTIVINANAGVRGISVYYPGQDFYVSGSARPYPWLFSLNGDNIYIKNVCAVNPYQLMDIASVKCDSHYIENVYAFPLLTGIRVGKGSTGGKLRNVHYNGTLIGQAYFPTDEVKLGNWNHAHMELLRFGNVIDQEMLFCFGRMCRAGVVLEDESGVGPNGISIGFGVESITQGACIEVRDNNGFQFINASLLSENNTINFDSPDTLFLFNSRTKQSRDFIKSSNQIGRLVFNQVLHRGDDTRIQFDKGEVEIVNGLFQNGLKIDLGSPDIPLRMYGVFVRTGLLEMNLDEPEVFWDYIPNLQAVDPSIKFNPDLFLFPGDIKITGVRDIKGNIPNRVRIFPNPASDVLHLEWRQEGELQTRIFDAGGRVVYSGRAAGNKLTIPVRLIGPPGMYYARFTGKNWEEFRLINIQ